MVAQPRRLGFFCVCRIIQQFLQGPLRPQPVFIIRPACKSKLFLVVQLFEAQAALSIFNRTGLGVLYLFDRVLETRDKTCSDRCV